jgi:hypothetical protein
MNFTATNIKKSIDRRKMNQEHEHKLKVTVHYVAEGKPFKDDDAERSETVGHLKQRVLTFFSLTEGQSPNGTVTTYTLYYEKKPLENMNQSLGEIAGEQRILQLKLNQQIVQGR